MISASDKPGQELAVYASQAIVLADEQKLQAEWMQALRRRVHAGEMSETSRYTYERGMAHFQDWCQQRQPGVVTDSVLLDWKSELRDNGNRPATINTWMSAVRSFYAWAVANHRLFYDPTKVVKGANRSGVNSRHRREALTDEEVRRVLAIPDRSTKNGKRNYAIMALMAYTAVRTVEIHRAEYKDLRTEGGKLVLDVRGKGHREADQMVVLSNPKASFAVRDWIAVRGRKAGPLFFALGNRVGVDGKLSLSFIRRMVKRAFRDAGVIGDFKTTHSLRHTAISSAIRHGAPVQKAQAMARHANISTTMIYYHEADRIEHPAEDFIDYGDDD